MDSFNVKMLKANNKYLFNFKTINGINLLTCRYMIDH